jgi:hypothetical protein
MMTLLVLRARLRTIYQKYELYIEPIVKFIIAIVVFQLINTSIGYDSRLKKLPIVLALSLLSTFTPSAILVLLAGLVTIAHVYLEAQVLSIIVIMIMLIMYCLFLRFTPKQGYVVLAIPILYLLKLPYLIPILLGLFATPLSIIPTSCGVIIFYLFKVIKEATLMNVNISLEDTLQLYTYVVNSLMNNKQMFLTILIFSLIILVTYFVKRMKFDYAHEVSVAAGALTCILGFLICDLRLDISEQIGAMILGTLASAIIAVIVQFFRLALDYTGVENVQFEDDDYYYYVKAIPKINVTTPQINVKRTNAQKITKTQGFGGNIKREVLSDENEDYEDDFDGYEKYNTTKRDDMK